MAATTLNPRAGTLTRLAHWLGRTWARGERKAAGALVSAGLTQKTAKALIWVVKLAILAGLLFVAFWLALLAGFVYLVATGKAQERDDTAEAEEVLDMVPMDMTKLREKVWYHPDIFNDDPDPRFED
jgi:hypothetical protein